MNLPDSGLPSDIYHLAKKTHQDAGRRGEHAGMPQLFMGGALVYIGATMLLKALKCDDVRKMLGGSVRGRPR